MRMFIPALGQKFNIAAPWTFKLLPEDRNEKAAKFFGFSCEYSWGSGGAASWRTLDDNYNTIKDFGPHLEITLPEGTQLSVDRYYIRKGSKDYDSITFYAKRPNDKKSIRFWVKLEDANNIEV